ncbi:hypothetical protein LPN01_00435 [Sphingomonas sp. A2-49]|uniref:hypothetical protein n=1 Tax=Sphingomonas sp. A2-49 TaxID=1391375 RepID=UPI0021CFE5E0|nr:hypothetical protein [Sphingomonas sp. A2-49]MCU6452539.1 hypothetical protein [Sphingomonas sp. A2-49]
MVAMLGLSIGSPAVAQKQTEMDTGSNIPIPRRARIAEGAGLSDIDRGRIAMAEFARCTVDRQSARVTGIAARPADKIDGPSLARLADDECLSSGELRFKPLLLRGALFVELYRRRNDARARKVAWQMPAVPFDPVVKTDPADATLSVQMALLAFAQCVVTRDPATASAVVMGPTASKTQNAAFAVLAPKLGSCLYDGQKITLSKLILEGALGEVLYRGTVPSVTTASQETR